jgi:hypothetical protein
LQHGFGAAGRFSLKKLLRPVLFAPPSMPAATLLQKMQRDRVHMALVIDEYGGVDGLVTIEDLIETVIGEIEDEHDEDENTLWKEEKPGVFVAQSVVPLDEFEAAIGLTLRADEDDADVAGGAGARRGARTRGAEGCPAADAVTGRAAFACGAGAGGAGTGAAHVGRFAGFGDGGSRGVHVSVFISKAISTATRAASLPLSC